jgi:hypothetical protein
MYCGVIRDFELSEFHIAVYTCTSFPKNSLHVAFTCYPMYKISKNNTLQFIRVFTYLLPVSHILPDDDPASIETCCLF